MALSRDIPKQTCLFICELSVILLILMACNLHLILDTFEHRFIFVPGNGSEYDYLNLILHPFVHLSWYHFILDGGAFILLYICLKDAGKIKRITCLFFSGTISFLFVNLFAYQSIVNGFCGLSGIAHGLMAVYSLEMMANGQSKKAALLTLGIVSTKSLYEMAIGQALFMEMHLGFCGTPVPASHAGGVIGGIIGFYLTVLMRKTISFYMKSFSHMYVLFFLILKPSNHDYATLLTIKQHFQNK